MEEKNLIEEVIALKIKVGNLEKEQEELNKKQEANSQLNMDLKLLSQTVKDLSNVVGDLKIQSQAMQNQMIDVTNASNREKATKWDKVWDKVLIIVVGAIAGYVVSHLGF